MGLDYVWLSYNLGSIFQMKLSCSQNFEHMSFNKTVFTSFDYLQIHGLNKTAVKHTEDAPNLI